MNFRELGLSEIFTERLAEQNIREATPIQTDLFSPILKGDSILGLAKTGTGKTLSYSAPLVEKISKLEDVAAADGSKKAAWAWILVPTRELAVQVKDTLSLLTRAESQIAVVVGGESEERQIDALGQARFVVATPGRLLDLLKQRKILTRDVEVVVMDEADRLLDMGFIDDIRAILSFLPKKPQLICVSATLNLGVEEVAFELGVEPLRFGVEEAMQTVEGLDHKVAFIGDEEKFHALVHYIFERKDQRGIVFSNYRERAHEIASRLRGLGCKADALSAQLAQTARRKIIEDYRSGDLKVLVGSDLAARGLDFLDVDYVVNVDLSEDSATYVHRVGRTARAGRKGQALSLIGFEDSFRIEKLERFLNAKIPTEEFPLEKLKGPLPRFGARIDGHSEDAYQNQNSGPSRGGPRGDRGDNRSRQGPRDHNRDQRGPRQDHPRSDRPQASSNGPARPAQNSHAAPRPAASQQPSPGSAPRANTHRSTKKPQGMWARVKSLVGGLFGSKTKTKPKPAHARADQPRVANGTAPHSQPAREGQSHRGASQHRSNQGGDGPRNNGGGNRSRRGGQGRRGPGNGPSKPRS
ncbi:MAG: DEAD/DEAH box helicase [Bdellovibrionota bacterium]